MYVTLEARTPCLLCNYQHLVIRFSDVRVNKNSLRETGTPLTSVGYRACPECGTPNGGDLVPVSPYRLGAEDSAKVRAARERRWPELGAAQ